MLQAAFTTQNFSDIEIIGEKKVMTPPVRKVECDYLQVDSTVLVDRNEHSPVQSCGKMTRRSSSNYSSVRRVLFQ